MNAVIVTRNGKKCWLVGLLFTHPLHLVHPPRVVAALVALDVVGLDVADHRHLVRVEALAVDDLLHGLLAHGAHVVG